MFAIATASLLALVNQVSGTPYISGGDTARGTDCSGLASWVANAASGRPVYGNRFNTGNEEAALRARGFLPGTAPGALNIGWNGGHTAVTLPDGTPVSSGEGGGVRIGGGGAFQRQFTHHMHLPMAPGDELPADLPLDGPLDAPLAPPAGPADLPAPELQEPVVIEAANFAPAPEAPAPAPEAPAPAPEMAV
ncbi:glycoside hydrolase [Mycobacterium sp. ST-F2]|uniref:glycoside hydrolase n=1 Tax=Mycobacterium sp. ST-F2 TaxID=1490484 RepID=UPI00093BAE00|nr:glycoside hydrolase [Mycobacterium sp. ST-F2]OKH82062.1 glycoside hydrolase [Mycobacterium sp. ST-F2]